jgi:hypothetical protein
LSYNLLQRMAGDSEEPGLILDPPVPSLWREGAAADFRVPTLALPASVACVDGSRYQGRIFIPATAAVHTGAMRAEEWLNAPEEFIPFVPDGEGVTLVNKREILFLSVPASPDGETGENPFPVRRIAIECHGQRLEGDILIDMPEGQTRVLDYVNRLERFVTLRAGAEHHLVCKAHITRVIEVRER